MGKLSAKGPICIHLICYWLAVRTANWLVRCASLKTMVPLFFALDHQYSTELSAVHLADIWQYPDPLVSHLKKRSLHYVSSWRTRSQPAVIDKGHECKVNRETKAVLNRAEAEYIEAQAQFLPFQGKLQETLVRQVMPKQTGGDDENYQSTTALIDNVDAMLAKLNTTTVFKDGLSVENVFTGKSATAAEQMACCIVIPLVLQSLNVSLNHGLFMLQV